MVLLFDFLLNAFMQELSMTMTHLVVDFDCFGFDFGFLFPLVLFDDIFIVKGHDTGLILVDLVIEKLKSI